MIEDLKEGLVPVVIADNGTVTKTNVDDINWYNYDEAKWANAVILTGTDTYEVGQTIPENNIESYFVWIPKYRYKLFNVEGNSISPQEIEIEINSEDTINSDAECIAPNKSGETGSCDKDKWMTHSAFTSLGENVTGIWVGKFETTGSISAPTVKPNVISLRSITGKEMYDTAWSFNRSLDSHMMKNTEWGAMAYLTNSKYGRGNSEVGANSNSSYITGCTNTITYFSGSIGASTTKNYSGVYDTSGGAWATMMAVYNNTVSQSGLNPSSIENKYIDRYTGTDINAKILGDATGETNGWNGDNSYFVYSSNPWFYRGGNYDNGRGAGVFGFNYLNGSACSLYGFRIVYLQLSNMI